MEQHIPLPLGCSLSWVRGSSDEARATWDSPSFPTPMLISPHAILPVTCATRCRLESPLSSLFLAPSPTPSRPSVLPTLPPEHIPKLSPSPALSSDQQRLSYSASDTRITAGTPNQIPYLLLAQLQSTGLAAAVVLSGPLMKAHHYRSERTDRVPAAQHNYSRTFILNSQPTFSTFAICSSWHVPPLSRTPFLPYYAWENSTTPEQRATCMWTLALPSLPP